MFNTNKLGGTIKNLGVDYSKGATIYNSEIGGLTNSNFGIIDSCFVSGSINGNPAASILSFGGLVGYGDGIIRNCYNLATLTAAGNMTRVGGIVGYMEDEGLIHNCYNVGDIVSSTYATGGIVGLSFNTVYNSFSLANQVNSTVATSLGGIVGSDNATVYNSYYSTSGSFSINLGTYVADLATAMSSKNSFGNSFTSGGTTYSWSTEYPWDFEKTWCISTVSTSQGDMQLPYLKAFLRVCEVELNIVVNDYQNGGAFLNILVDGKNTQQVYITTSHNIVMEMTPNQEVTLIVTKPFAWGLTYAGSGTRESNAYTFFASSETHTITITAVNLDFNNTLVI